MSAPLSVAAAVDEYLDLLHDEREADGKLHPSSMWGCGRRAVYEARGTPQSNPHSAATRRRFRIGHLIHAFAGEALATSPDIVAMYPEFEVRGDIDAGHGDALVELGDGRYVVVEAKSSKDAHPKLDGRHARQGAHYAVRARTGGAWTAEGEWLGPLGDALLGVVVVYFGKTALDVTEYWLPYDPAWEERLEERLAELSAYLDQPESLPTRQTDAKSSKSRACYGCPFVDRCWMVDPAGAEPC